MQRVILTKRDFLGDETWRKWKQDEEEMLRFRNEVSAKKGKPDPQDVAMIRANKPWIEFYKSMLYDNPKQNKVAK